MALFRQLTLGLLARRLARSLDTIGAELKEQNVLLARLADHFAPAPAAHSPADVAAQSGVDHLDTLEAGLVLDYIERTHAATGHRPSDEEILIHLADEKTTDLHARLKAREDELARLASERALR